MANATLERAMAKRNDISVKMDAAVADECRIAAAFKGVTLAEYISETMRVAAKSDIDAAVARRNQASSRMRPKGEAK